MVLQYKEKLATRWKKYPGKDRVDGLLSKYDFRLLGKNKTNILVEKGSYKKVMKRFRQIEFFKHNQ